MNVRRVVQSDIGEIARAARETARQEGLLAARPEEISERDLSAKIDSLRERGLFIVLEHGGGLLGHLLLEPMELQSTRHVVRLTIVIHPGQTGKGYGRLLIAYAIKWASETAAVEKIELNVRATNSRAVKLYESLGFVIEGVHKERIRLSDQYADDVAMALFVRGS